MSFGFEISGDDEVLVWLNKANDADIGDLRRLIGAQVESQTQRRIMYEQTSPDGQRWAAWSETYAETRTSENQLLVGLQDLFASIGMIENGDEVLVGSNSRYAAIHQFGGLPGMKPGPAAIPQRQYVGLSGENFEDVRQTVLDWLNAEVMP